MWYDSGYDGVYDGEYDLFNSQTYIYEAKHTFTWLVFFSALSYFIHTCTVYCIPTTEKCHSFLHYAELKFIHFSCKSFILHQLFSTWLTMQQNHLLDPDQVEKCLRLFHISIPLQMKWNVSCDGYNFLTDKSKWLLHLKILHHSLVNESVHMNERKINRNVRIRQVAIQNNQ